MFSLALLYFNHHTSHTLVLLLPFLIASSTKVGMLCCWLYYPQGLVCCLAQWRHLVKYLNTCMSIRRRVGGNQAAALKGFQGPSHIPVCFLFNFFVYSAYKSGICLCKKTITETWYPLHQSIAINNLLYLFHVSTYKLSSFFSCLVVLYINAPSFLEHFPVHSHWYCMHYFMLLQVML